MLMTSPHISAVEKPQTITAVQTDTVFLHVAIQLPGLEISIFKFHDCSRFFMTVQLYMVNLCIQDRSIVLTHNTGLLLLPC